MLIYKKKKSIVNVKYVKYDWVFMFGFLNEVYEGCVYINDKGISFYNKYICEILLYYCVLMILFI